MVNEEFIATLDYLVASSLWASITDARDQAQDYLHRVNYYKHLDRQEGNLKSNWRDNLYECLLKWQSRFPKVVLCWKSTLTGGAAAVTAFPADWF